MADDQTNPYTMMGMLGMMTPNKYLNPMYKDKPLPMPGYYGDPTDAMGGKIQSYQDTKAKHDAWDTAHPQGTTLTSVPAQSSSPQMDQLAGWQALTNPEMAARGNTYGDPYLNMITNNTGTRQGDGGQGGSNSMTDSVLSGLYGGQLGTAGGATAGAGGAKPSGGGTNPFDMRQAYLDALSDPQGGKPMPVQGAAVPVSQPLGTPSVMSSFLQAHPSGASTGSYSNKPFFDTLNQLRSA